MTEQTYRTDAHAARAEFSSLLNTVQASLHRLTLEKLGKLLLLFVCNSVTAMQTTLAELKLEVGAAQQLSNHAVNQLPQGHKTTLQEHMQWDLYDSSPAVSPRISTSTPHDGTNLLRQNALMRQLQESLAAHGTQAATIEGMPRSTRTHYTCDLLLQDILQDTVWHRHMLNPCDQGIGL